MRIVRCEHQAICQARGQVMPVDGQQGRAALPRRPIELWAQPTCT